MYRAKLPSQSDKISHIYSPLHSPSNNKKSPFSKQK